jgi:hypothetical protein
MAHIADIKPVKQPNGRWLRSEANWVKAKNACVIYFGMMAVVDAIIGIFSLVWGYGLHTITPSSFSFTNFTVVAIAAILTVPLNLIAMTRLRRVEPAGLASGTHQTVTALRPLLTAVIVLLVGPVLVEIVMSPRAFMALVVPLAFGIGAAVLNVVFFRRAIVLLKHTDIAPNQNYYDQLS